MEICCTRPGLIRIIQVSLAFNPYLMMALTMTPVYDADMRQGIGVLYHAYRVRGLVGGIQGVLYVLTVCPATEPRSSIFSSSRRAIIIM